MKIDDFQRQLAAVRVRVPGSTPPLSTTTSGAASVTTMATASGRVDDVDSRPYGRVESPPAHLSPLRGGLPVPQWPGLDSPVLVSPTLHDAWQAFIGTPMGATDDALGIFCQETLATPAALPAPPAVFTTASAPAAGNGAECGLDATSAIQAERATPVFTYLAGMPPLPDVAHGSARGLDDAATSGRATALRRQKRRFADLKVEDLTPAGHKKLERMTKNRASAARSRQRKEERLMGAEQARERLAGHLRAIAKRLDDVAQPPTPADRGAPSPRGWSALTELRRDLQAILASADIRAEAETAQAEEKPTELAPGQAEGGDANTTLR